MILESAARAAGVPLELHSLEDGSTYYALPADVYQAPDDESVPTFGDLRDVVDAIARRSNDAPTPQQVIEAALYWLRADASEAEEKKAKFEHAVAIRRDKRALPVAHYGRPDELLARYETAAERTLQRALTSLHSLRDGLGPVGKNEDEKAS